jgi:ParB family transcriptional regulator, chromosome partitioning protein
LGALIPGSDDRADAPASAAASAGGSIQVPVDQIAPNPWQPRRTFAQDALRELADSIREHGLIQPLVLTRSHGHDAGDAIYTLIAGERRLQAARLAGLDAVPAIVKDATSQEMLELALVENLQRADLNPLEEALAFRQLIDEFGLTQQRVAERVGKSRVAVANSVRLLRLPEEIKARLGAGEISEGHARALLQLEEAASQLQVLKRIIADNLSVRQTEDLVRRMLEAQPRRGEENPRSARLTAEQRAVENDLRLAFGTRVRLVQTNSGNGRLVVEFFSEEELQHIYDIVMRGQPRS